jgi:hypothetical protein
MVYNNTVCPLLSTSPPTAFFTYFCKKADCFDASLEGNSTLRTPARALSRALQSIMVFRHADMDPRLRSAGGDCRAALQATLAETSVLRAYDALRRYPRRAIFVISAVAMYASRTTSISRRNHQTRRPACRADNNSLVSPTEYKSPKQKPVYMQILFLHDGSP